MYWQYCNYDHSVTDRWSVGQDGKWSLQVDD